MLSIYAQRAFLRTIPNCYGQQAYISSKSLSSQGFETQRTVHQSAQRVFTTSALAQQRRAMSTKNNSITVRSSEKVHVVLEEFRAHMMHSLSAINNVSHFLASMSIELEKNPALLSCSRDSLLHAMVECAHLQLEPGPLAHCYFIPRKGKVELMVSYKGLILILSRVAPLLNVRAVCVYSNDRFFYTEGTSPRIEHEPASENRGQLTKVYTVISFQNGTSIAGVYDRNIIMKHKECSDSRNSPYSPWNKWEEEMWKKCAIRKLIKLIPIDLTKLNQSLPKDEMGTHQIPTNQNPVLPAGYAPSDYAMPPEEKIQNTYGNLLADHAEAHVSPCSSQDSDIDQNIHTEVENEEIITDISGDEEWENDSGSYTLRFGAHKGKTLSNVPRGYLQWIVKLPHNRLLSLPDGEQAQRMTKQYLS